MTGHSLRHKPVYLEFMRHFIVEAIKKLGRARPVDLERYFEKAFCRHITDDAFKKYAEMLVKEGILRREIIIDNSGTQPANSRRYRMVWYLLK